MTNPSPVYFGPDGCGTCGRKVNGGRASGAGAHADWCADVRAILADPDGRRAQRFRDALPSGNVNDLRMGRRWSA